MDQKQFDAVLSDAETRLRRLKTLYEQWFMGIERLEPSLLRKELEDLLARLRKEQVSNTAQRFRLQQLVQRHVSFSTYWRRIGRQIEEGTFQRDVLRARRRAQHGRAGRAEDGPEMELSYDVDLDAELADVLEEANRAAEQALAKPPPTAAEPITATVPQPAQITPESNVAARTFFAPGAPLKPPPPSAAHIGMNSPSSALDALAAPLKPTPAAIRAVPPPSPLGAGKLQPPGGLRVPLAAAANANGAPAEAPAAMGQAARAAAPGGAFGAQTSDRAPAPFGQAGAAGLAGQAHADAGRAGQAAQAAHADGGLTGAPSGQASSASQVSAVAAGRAGESLAAGAAQAPRPPASANGQGAARAAQAEASRASQMGRPLAAGAGHVEGQMARAPGQAEGRAGRPAPPGAGQGTRAEAGRSLAPPPSQAGRSPVPPPGRPQPPARPGAPAVEGTAASLRPPGAQRAISPFALPAGGSLRPKPIEPPKPPPPPPALTPKYPAPQPTAAAKPAPAARPPAAASGNDFSAGDVERVYSQYMAARQKNAERTDNVKRDTIEKTIRGMLPQLEKKHAGKKIDFEVVVKDGKVALKPVAK